MAVFDDGQGVNEIFIKRTDVGSHGFLPCPSRVRRGKMQTGDKR